MNEKLRKADEILMKMMAYNLRYRKLEERPQTRFAIMATIVAVRVTYAAIAYPSRMFKIFSVIFWLNAFYE